MSGRVFSLANRCAICTGAGQGIGKEIALSLIFHGARVLAADINGETLERLSKEVSTEYGSDKLVIKKTDVGNVKEIEAMVDECARSFGRLDILVNNAGILHSTPIEGITEQEWDKIMAVDLKSVFFASQKALPLMKKNGWGRIINMSSLAGRMGGYANGLVYSAAKAGIIGLTRGMASRVASFGITVNAVAPGTTESEIIKQFSVEQKNDLKAKIPMGRLGRPEDIADLVTFLSSEMAGFVTGAVIDINGGMYMG